MQGLSISVPEVYIGSNLQGLFISIFASFCSVLTERLSKGPINEGAVLGTEEDNPSSMDIDTTNAEGDKTR